MAVYVDDPLWRWAGHKWGHMLADSEEELHSFAARIGIHRLLYQGPPRTSAPHYDITGLERARAIKLGAIACNREQIVAVFRRVKVKNGKVHRARPVKPAVVEGG